jgi:hypothetical protein
LNGSSIRSLSQVLKAKKIFDPRVAAAGAGGEKILRTKRKVPVSSWIEELLVPITKIVSEMC